MTKIDEKDREILYSLFQNCRRSDSAIGTEVKVSKQRVQYRIKNMEKRGVLLGYTVGLNKGLFGLQRFSVFVRFSQDFDVSKAIDRVRLFEEVSTVMEYIGKWDVSLTVWAKDNESIHLFIKKLLALFPVEKISVLGVVDSQMKLYDILRPSKTFQDIPKKEIYKIRAIDDVDSTLIDLLKKNSRESLISLSNKLKLSITATKSRINKLYSSGVISRFFAAIDMTKLGYQEVQFLCNISPKKYELVEKLIGYLSEKKEVLYVLRTIGEWNFCFSMYLSSQEDLRSLIRELNSRFVDVLTDYETLVISHVI